MIRIACSDSEASCVIAGNRLTGEMKASEKQILGGGVYEIEGPTAETVAIIRERRCLY